MGIEKYRASGFSGQHARPPRRRNVDGRHPYTVTDADFDLFTRYFVPPTPEKGSTLVVH